jgi:hypothetical protein
MIDANGGEEIAPTYDLANELGLTTERLSNLIYAIAGLGEEAEGAYNQLQELNSKSQYYAEDFALAAI